MKKDFEGRQKEALLLEAIGQIDGEYIEEADAAVCAEGSAVKPKGEKRRALTKLLAAAACLCIIVTAGMDTLRRFDYSLTGAGGDGGESAYIGTIVGENYYYEVKHSGVWMYHLEKESREKIISSYWIDSWQVNEYGIYYECGREFGVIPHETGKRQTLYEGNLFTCDKLRFTILPDGNIILTELNINRRIRTELLLDGETGEVLETVMEPTAYEDIVIAYSDAYFQLGNRELMLVPITDDRWLSEIDMQFYFDLQENGKSVLPEGVYVRKNPEMMENSIWFICGGDETNQLEKVYIARADGEDTSIQRPSDYYSAGTGHFAFYPNENRNGVCCIDARTGETWELASSNEHHIYTMETDGTWLFTDGIEYSHHVQWKIVYDDAGRPATLELVDGDFGK